MIIAMTSGGLLVDGLALMMMQPTYLCYLCAPNAMGYPGSDVGTYDFDAMDTAGGANVCPYEDAFKAYAPYQNAKG